MRMWMIDPRLMCDQHLLGEHGEIHKHRHNFVSKHNMSKRVALGQIEPKSMRLRHDALVVEMLSRGMNHHSPYEQPDISYLSEEDQLAEVNVEKSLLDLIGRCERCARRSLVTSIIE